MTQEENKAKKAEEKKKELEEEFNEYLSNTSGTTIKSYKKQKLKLQEKLEQELHRMLLLSSQLNDKTVENEPINKFITRSMKILQNETNALTSTECILQSSILMKEAINVMTSKIENLDENIKSPSTTYHFYKDPNPVEGKLVHNPVMQLLSRIRVTLNPFSHSIRRCL